jgi:apolipoprotein N-acyltransferase
MAAVTTGIALAASFPPLGLWPLAWMALLPLLRGLHGRTAGARLALGGLAGLVWTASTAAPWLYTAARSHLATGPLAAVALTGAGLWTYGAMYLAGFSLLYPWLPSPRWLAAPAAWVLLEEVRGRALGGAPWALLGHSQHAVLPLAQVAELAGVPGLSFLVLVPTAALAEHGRARRLGLAVAGALLLGTCAFGVARMRAFPPTAATGPPRIRVLSGFNLASDPLGAYLAATQAGGQAELTIWPETAVPRYLDDQLAAAARIAAAARADGWLLFGALRYEGNGRSRRYFNTVLLYDPWGRVRASYDKRRLVPIAERSPVAILETLRRPFSPGREPIEPLATESLLVGPLICWEAIFPDLAREYVRKGANLLVNLSSDRDLGAGAAQLTAFSRFRAIETRRWLVRASGTGTSLVIDPAGRVETASTLDIGGALPRSLTPYVRYGHLVPSASATAIILLALSRIRTRRRIVG